MMPRKLIPALAVLLLLSGCTIDPPLHLRKLVETDVVMNVNVEAQVMWQPEWDVIWRFPWDEERWGPLEYEMPKSTRMHIYTLGAGGLPVSHTPYSFYGTSSRVSLFTGTHDFLFHNNDSEVNLFRSDSDISDVQAYTRVISPGLKGSTPVRTTAQKAMSTKADDTPIDEQVAYQPDDLFSLYKSDVLITDNLDDYEYIDGRYVFRISGKMLPVSFIYLIQVNLLNNNGRVIGCNGGGALSGVASGANLHTRMTASEAVTVPFDVNIDREKNPDILGGRLLCFGIPGCDPYDEQSVKEAPDGHNSLVLSLTYNDYTYKNIRIDVTDQFRDLPTGGVITIELDVNDFPPGGGGDGPVTESGGFKPIMNEWGEQTGSTTIIS